MFFLTLVAETITRLVWFAISNNMNQN